MIDCIVIGIGEVGKPLSEILKEKYNVVTKDIEPLILEDEVRFLHIAYPFSNSFLNTTEEYIKLYQPDITIIHSTVVPGTTKKIQEDTKKPLVYSPVRGKHRRMREDLLYYTKYIAGDDPDTLKTVEEHLSYAGFKVKRASSIKGLETAKLIETTYFGLLIAWAQEVNRFAEKIGEDYRNLLVLTEEVDYLPNYIFAPGYIGGHCVIPNIHLLKRINNSNFLDVILDSNERRKTELKRDGITPDMHFAPVKIK